MLSLTYRSSIGSIYLTGALGVNAAGSVGGQPVYCEWKNFGTDRNVIRTPVISLPNASAAVRKTVTETKTLKDIVLGIDWCPIALYDLLKAAFVTGGSYTATIYRPEWSSTPRTYTVEYGAVSFPGDTQWEATDPIEQLTVQLLMKARLT